MKSNITEFQEGTSPAEIRKAEKRMSPLEGVMTRARAEVMSHEKDFMAVGVTEQQVEKASRQAGERVKLEFEKREKEDPLCRIERALENAAETADEKLLVQAVKERLENFRSNWAEWLGKKKLAAQHAGQPFSIREAVRKASEFNSTPGFVDTRRVSKDRVKDFPSVRILDVLGIMRDGKSQTIEPSDALKERLLKKLGALKENQTLDDLKLLPPRREGYRGPTYHKSRTTERITIECAQELPTNIPGVDVRIDFAWPLIQASMDLKTLERVTSFPKS